MSKSFPEFLNDILLNTGRKEWKMKLSVKKKKGHKTKALILVVMKAIKFHFH